MVHDTGFSRRSSSERDIQPVSIVSVDPTTRTAVAVTRIRSTLTVNCAYATGDTITTPMAGEQWYVERFDGEWRLYGRIPFNDATLNIAPEAGQVSVGSATGPLELNGTEVRANGKVFRLNGVYYRDSGTALERSTDKTTWTAITPADTANLIPAVAEALTGFDGTDPTAALAALTDWGGLVQTVLENFSAFWNEICQNVFVGGLKRMGFGDTDLSKIISGGQNFANYLFSVIFCDFDGDLTPQTVLARIRDLLAPVINNPFIKGLQAIAEILEVAVGNLLNDAVEGATALMELMFNIISCNWDALLPQLGKIASIIGLVGDDTPFSPANILKQVFGVFNFLGNPTTLVGGFFAALADFFGLVGEATGNLLQDAVSGAVEFFQVVFGILTCNPAALDKAALVVAEIPGVGAIPSEIVRTLSSILSPLTDTDNPVGAFLAGLRDFAEAMGNSVTNLADGAISGAVEVVRAVFGIMTCRLTPEQIAALPTIIASSSGSVLPADILKFFFDTITPLTDMNGLVGKFLAGLKSFAELAGNTVSGLLDGALIGAVEFIKTVVGVLTCDPGQLLSLTSLIDGILPGLDTPLAILASLGGVAQSLLSNSWVQILTGVAAKLGVNGNLIQQLLGGASGFLDWVFALLTKLVPFIDWDSLKTLDFPDLMDGVLNSVGILDFFDVAEVSSWLQTNIVASIVRAITGGAIGTVESLTTFFANLRSLLGGNLLTGFTIPTAAAALITNLNQSAVQLATSVIADFPITKITNLISHVTGVSSTDPAAIQRFFSGFTGFNATTGANNLASQISAAVTGKAAGAVLADIATFLGIGAGNGGLVAFSGSGTTLINQVVTRITGSSSNLTLTDLANVFTNLRKMLAIADPATLLAAPATFVAGLATVANNFVNNFLSLGAFFTNLRNFFGGSIDFTSGAFNTTTAVQSFLSGILQPANNTLKLFAPLDGEGLISIDSINKIDTWIEDTFSKPIIGTLLSRSGVDLAALGIDVSNADNLDLGALGVWASKLLTPTSKISVGQLVGTIGSGLLGVIPVSNISQTSANLLTQGAFGASATVEAADGWSWDETQNYTGTGGSAKVSVTSAKLRELFSRQSVPVSAGDRLRLSSYIKTASLVGATPLGISLILYNGKNPTNGTVAASTVSMATSGSNAAWTKISNATVYTVPANVTSVIVRLSVAATATSGTAWFDEVSLVKEGALQQPLVDNLVTTWQTIWNGIFGTGGDSKTWQDMFSAMYALNGTATQGVTNAGIADGKAQSTVDGINQAVTGTSATGALPATVVNNIGGITNYARSSVASGSNLLADPGAEFSNFWTQSTVSRVTTQKRSSNGSLRIVSAGAAERAFYWTVVDTGEVRPIVTQPSEVFAVECYVLAPTANVGLGTVTLTALVTNSLTGAWTTITPALTLTFTAGTKNSWQKLSGNYTIPDGYDRVAFGIKLAVNATTTNDTFYIDDMVVRETTNVQATLDAIQQAIYGGNATNNPATAVKAGIQQLNSSLFGQLTVASTLREAAIPGLPAGRINSGSFSSDRISDSAITTSKLAELAITNAKIADAAVQTAKISDYAVTGGKTRDLDGSRITTGTVNTNMLNVNAIGARINPTAGSGAILIRDTTSVYPAGQSGRTIIGNGFFTESLVNTPDISILSGNTGFRVAIAGWYMVEIAYKLNPVASWGWNLAPLLYKNGDAYKTGTDCLYTWGGHVGISLPASSGSQRYVQNSFIVYLNANETVQAGYDIQIGANVGDTNVLGGGSSSETYCSISLLNRSYS